MDSSTLLRPQKKAGVGNPKAGNPKVRTEEGKVPGTGCCSGETKTKTTNVIKESPARIPKPAPKLNRHGREKIKFRNAVKLLQPPLLDFSLLRKEDKVKIVIHNTQHKFSTDAEASGKDSKNQPIFGSSVYINGKLHS